MPGALRFDEVSRKWLNFAERRLEYFTTLYRSGRWQRYYTKERFAAIMLDVIKGVRAWRRLSRRTPVPPGHMGTKDLRPAA